jgi:hypothetical protein
MGAGARSGSFVEAEAWICVDDGLPEIDEAKVISGGLRP